MVDGDEEMPMEKQVTVEQDASDADDFDYGNEKPDFTKAKLATKQAAFLTKTHIYFSSQNTRISGEVATQSLEIESKEAHDYL
jgi:uncharacterized FlgJ-related protein